MLGPETPTTLTAQFTNLPTEHDGSSTFEVWVGFSHDLRNSYTHLHEHPTVTGGKLESTSRFDGRSDLWKFLIEPDGDGTGRSPSPLARCPIDGDKLGGRWYNGLRTRGQLQSHE